MSFSDQILERSHWSDKKERNNARAWWLAQRRNRKPMFRWAETIYGSYSEYLAEQTQHDQQEADVEIEVMGPVEIDEFVNDLDSFYKKWLPEDTITETVRY